ncbi:hypothetical protein MIR68_001410 [Amoeboaphelidium protococcarum]|nr:hypothetical protein MIR68_001410 [Amoeboaphelidium protococcarum]
MSEDQGQNDLAVQATNNSSIMSKASMYKLGYVSDYDRDGKIFNQFLTAVAQKSNVKIPRRAPLINRGYYIRHKAVRHVVERFMQETKRDAQRQIINLGCGYDATYFQMFSQSSSSLSSLSQQQYGDHSSTLYIDIDFKRLLKQKIKMILDSPDLNSMLSNVKLSTGGVLLSSDQYLCIGCDLTQSDKLDKLLSYLAQSQQSAFSFNAPTLIISECVLTYVPTLDANKVISYFASRFKRSWLALYEQILPYDVFGKVMTRHFVKMNAAIHAIYDYPTASQQQKRFLDCGWSGVELLTMEQFWNDELSLEERLRVDDLEFFDEHEEWLLKCSHYFIAVGKSQQGWKQSVFKSFSLEQKSQGSIDYHGRQNVFVEQQPLELQSDISRWGHSACILSNGRIVVYGGYDKISGSRCGDVLIIHNESVHRLTHHLLEKLMYHTMVVDDADNLFIYGGRQGQNFVSNRLVKMIIKFNDNQVPQIDVVNHVDLSIPGLYRHCCAYTKLPDQNGDQRDVLLIYGGRQINSTISNKLYMVDLLSYEHREIDCNLPHLHSCAMSIVGGNLYIFGGLDNNTSSNTTLLSVDLQSWQSSCAIMNCPFKGIFGHQMVYWKDDLFLVVGGMQQGVITDGVGPNYIQMALLDIEAKSLDSIRVSNDKLLIGHDLVQSHQGSDEFIVVGGGAVCFSMGSYCEKSFKVSLNDLTTKVPWLNVKTQVRNLYQLEENINLDIAFVARAALNNCGQSAFGPRNYLDALLSHDTKVSYHTCDSSVLQFAPEKNYNFDVCTWSQFVDDIFSTPGGKSPSSHRYFRSIGENPRKQASCLAKQFPRLANDVQLPIWLIRKLMGVAAVSDQEVSAAMTLEDFAKLPNYFSSVLRISSDGLQMWPHFDIMDNALMQLSGRKLVVLFPPSQMSNLYIEPDMNSSSSPVTFIYAPHATPFNDQVVKNAEEYMHKYPRFYNEAVKHAKFVILEPGDVLYIPSLWIHQTVALSDGGSPSVGVNIFWKALPDVHYVKKDLYGNNDLIKAQEAFKHLEKARYLIDEIPDSKFREFYKEKFQRLLR